MQIVLIIFILRIERMRGQDKKNMEQTEGKILIMVEKSVMV